MGEGPQTRSLWTGLSVKERSEIGQLLEKDSGSRDIFLKDGDDLSMLVD